jgi:CRISPR-associated protein Cmr2
MTEYLLLIALGPVQEFIAQARRTRDLWFGSHALSEISRVVAARLAETEGVSLIFPALKKGDRELEACDGITRSPGGHPPLSIANKIFAVVQAEDRNAARDIAKAARSAARARWRRMADGVRAKTSDLLGKDVDFIWNEQIDRFLEFYAAWAPVAENYRNARDKVEHAIATRKNLREFAQWQYEREGVPRSSLDGTRQSVLAEPSRRDPELVRRYRISEGEQLDAVGLIKRAGGTPEQFVSVINVGLACWVDWAKGERPEAFTEFLDVCNKILPESWGVRKTIACGRIFPFNASLLLRSRMKAIEKDLGEENVKKDKIGLLQRQLDRLFETSANGGKSLPEPFPYVACLAADGDRMGKTIDAMQNPDRHRNFSEKLSEFAREARKIVEDDHLGMLVYSGGDDVLAFLPIPKALACAKALKESFASAMTGICAGTSLEPPTLSVGVGIGHIMESMGDLLDLGRNAEQLAKQGFVPDDHLENSPRNAVAIVVDRRAGGQLRWRCRWSASPESCPTERLSKAKGLMRQGRLSSRKIYQIQEVLKWFRNPDHDNSAALIHDVTYALSRTHSGESEMTPAEAGLWEKKPETVLEACRAIESWVARMLIAKLFAEAEPGFSSGTEGHI